MPNLHGLIESYFFIKAPRLRPFSDHDGILSWLDLQNDIKRRGILLPQIIPNSYPMPAYENRSASALLRNLLFFFSLSVFFEDYYSHNYLIYII